MAWICDKNGNHRCEIKQLSYNGTFMEVSSITVTVESPAPIAFAIGDYIDWDYDGLRYTLDTAAGVEKQARRNSVGNAFLYENLVFLSPLQAAQNADFFDVILGNTNDFLTNTEFSFYGTAWDYAKRLEANLCRLYGSGTWKVRIWTNGTCYDATPATGIDTGAWENKLVDVSGIKCLGGFQQIYDLWGCAYVFSVVSGVNYVDFYDDFEQYAKAWQAGGVDKIFAYGKGNGLYKIRHTPDADHVLVTRLRPYGSGDNIPANYYLNSEEYHVDGNESSELAISHLMLPASQWTKDGVKHPSNAYLEQNTDLYGVREGVVLWDGSDPELGEIKPSIYRLSIQDLLDLMAAGDSYRPDEAKWPDTTQRIDKIITGAAPVDNGVKNEAGYDFTETEASGSLAAHSFGTGGSYAYIDIEFDDLVMGTTPSVSHLAEFRIVPTSQNKIAVSFDVQASIAGTINSVTAYLTPYVAGVKVEDATYPCLVSEETISRTVDGITYTKRYNISLLDSTGNPIVFSTLRTGAVTFRFRAHIDFATDNSGFPYLRDEYAVDFDLIRGNKAIDGFFSVTIPQIGFDLSAAVANGAKLCMRSGANQPREFQIVPSSVRYLPDTDTWYVRCKRSVDQSISTYFPNSNAVIAAGDEYYFTGITMPPLYVEIAAQKLLEAATAWLALHSKSRMLSAVDVDNKVMAVEEIVLKEGMSLPISDTDLDIQPGTQESRIIDNIRIEEGSDAIRTFSVTLRDKKEKSSLDAAIRGATSNLATNSSVNEAVSAAVNTGHGSLAGRDMPNQHPISAITGLEEALLSSGFFELGSLSGLVQLRSNYDYIGPRKGLIFESVAESEVDSSPAHLMLRNFGTAETPNYALYTPYAIISKGDQIVGSGTPGGGSGGGSSYLWELLDVDDNLQSPAAGALLQYDSVAGLWKGNAPATQIGAGVTGFTTGALIRSVLGDDFNTQWSVKQFINSSIATATATFRGTNTTATTESAFLTWANGLTHDLNDYVFWKTTDSLGNTVYKRYKYDGSQWVFEYELNNSSFTSQQWDAINSGITSGKVGTYDTIAGYFSGGKILSTAMPTMYIGDAQVKFSAQTAQNIGGLGNIAVANGRELRFLDNPSSGSAAAINTLKITSANALVLGGGTLAKGYQTAIYGSPIRFYTDVAGGSGATRMRIDTDGTIVPYADIIPNSNNAYDLGSSAAFFAETWTKKLYLADGIYLEYVPASGNTPGYVHLSSHLLTDGDQIVKEGVPGGGGGGGASYLHEMLDVYGNPGDVKRGDGTTRQGGDLLGFNSTLGLWVAVDKTTVGITTAGTVAELNAASPSNDKRVWSPSVLASWLSGKGFLTSAVTNVAAGGSGHTDELAITKGSTTSYVTAPYATTAKRLKAYVGTAEAGSYDLNTLLSGGGITSQYTSVNCWANGPANMSYGGVAQFNRQTSDSLAMQLAWDVVHDRTQGVYGTGKLWWRDATYHDGAADWGSWHLIYDDTTLTKAVVTGLLGNNTYHPYGGAATIDFAAKALSVSGAASFGATNTPGYLYLLRNSYNYVWATTAGGIICMGVADKGTNSFANATLTVNQYGIGVGGNKQASSSYALDVAGAAHTSGKIYPGSNVVLPNGVSLQGYDTSDNPIALAYVNSSDAACFGYGVRESGTSILYGKTINLLTTDTNAGPDIYIGGAAHNKDAASIFFNAHTGSGNVRNGIKVAAEHATGVYYDIQNLVVYTSRNTTTSPYSPVWEKALEVKYDGKVNIGTPSDTSGKLNVDGDLVTMGDQVMASDERIKRNFKAIELSVDQIASCRAVSFDWAAGGHSFGSVAQDWEPLVPEAVKQGDIKTLAYGQLALVAAINIAKHETEQDKEIRVLKDALGNANGRIEALEKEVKRLRS